jgi:hypothetical protein
VRSGLEGEERAKRSGDRGAEKSVAFHSSIPFPSR